MATRIKVLLILALVGVGCSPKPPQVQVGPPDGPQVVATPGPPTMGPDTTLNVPAPAVKLRPVVVLEATGKDTTEFGDNPVLLVELVRQALLIAGRDSLGLATRDARLRELGPDDLPAENTLRLNVRFMANPPSPCTVEQGPARKKVYGYGLAALTLTPKDVPNLTEAAEKLSREGFVTALRQAGFDGRPNPVKADAPVPEAVEKLLGEMTFTAQYAAVRQLHAACRADGESPQIVGALVRGYAHLGMMTELQYAPFHKVFKARALLYAQRLVAAEPGSPWGLWHRAYASALTGLHQDALNDLAAAGKLSGGKPLAWAPLIEALCHFDAEKLSKPPADAGLKQLAALLHFLAAESPTSAHRTLQAARTALQAQPECYRVHDMVSAVAGVSTRHQTTVANIGIFSLTFPARVAKTPGLPGDIAERIEAGVEEPLLMRSLAAAGRGDSGEPSWTVLARLGQEERFLQVCRRLHFMAFQWAVPVGDFLEESRPFVADHPWLGFIQCYGLEPGRQSAQAVRLIEALPAREMDYRHTDVARLLERFDPGRAQKLYGQMFRVIERTYMDYALWFYNTPAGRRQEIARRMLEFAPHAPVARTTLVSDDWDKIQPHAADWEKDYPHPDVLFALGAQYIRLKQFADAERCLKACFALSPDFGTCRNLAGVYKALGQPDQMIATLEKALEVEDTGLNHAQVRVDLAYHYMRQKDFKKAEPYAAEAAETWAGWAMECAITCYEGLQDWEKAELWVRRNAERYDYAYKSWFYWCKRTGQGDAEAARRFLEARLEQGNARTAASGLENFAFYYLLTDQPQKAAETFQKMGASRPDGYGWVWAALLHDELGQAEERDKALRAVPEKSPDRQVAELLQASLAEGPTAVPDVKTVDKLIKETAPEQRPASFGYIGRFLELRGRRDEAIDAYRICESRAPPNQKQHPVPVVAGWGWRALEKIKPKD